MIRIYLKARGERAANAITRHSMKPEIQSPNLEQAVLNRYSIGARSRQPDLCCPVQYDERYLEKIPLEILERDYGCGDPSRHLKPGETVLDLGSGAGKICYIAAQIVGPAGRVIGVDMNDDMLALSRKWLDSFAARVGYANLEFRKGRIQDLALNLEKFDAWLAAHPVGSAAEMDKAGEVAGRLRETEPLIASNSVDVVVSNCVLNLITQRDRNSLFAEIFRVLKEGGRAVISDIVSDELVPAQLQADGELWSGCVSGAMREDLFLEAFASAGFHGIRILSRDEQPWRRVNGIEFRGMTIEAFKAAGGPNSGRLQAIIYRGPFREVLDDFGVRLVRGERVAVGEQTWKIYQRAPYRDAVELIEPGSAVTTPAVVPLVAPADGRRDARAGKGTEDTATTAERPCCEARSGSSACH